MGCFLIRKIGQEIYKARIVEIEAYHGPLDLASHASRGRTPRNSLMFGEPGIIYVYLTYGLHYMLNIVTGEKDFPAAVLIRAIEVISKDKINKPMRSGPAKLTKAFFINKDFNGLPIYIKKHGLWLEDREKNLKNFKIVKTKRIGVDYAGKFKDKKWRFYIKGNGFVSKV